jgi:RHS repeat-associated protein
MKNFNKNIILIIAIISLARIATAQAPTYPMGTDGPTYACSSTSGTLSVVPWGTSPTGQMIRFEEGQVVNGVFTRTNWINVPPNQYTYSYSITAAGTKSYRGVLSNGSGEVPTNVVTIVVSPAATVGLATLGPEFTATSRSYCFAASGTMKVASWTGASIKWQKSINYGSWEDIPGATSSTYSFTNVTTSTEYHAVVTNGACSKTSNSVNVFINQIPTLSPTPPNVIEGEKTTLTVIHTDYAGTLYPEYSYDGTTWLPILGTVPGKHATFPIHRKTYFRVGADMNGACARQYTNIAEVTMRLYTDVTPVNINGANYKKQQIVLTKGVKNPHDVSATTGIQKRETVTYQDGAGRDIQKSMTKATPSPSQADLVYFYDYDAAGRLDKEFLPYEASTSNGAYAASPAASQQSFYAITSDKVADSPHPYVQTIFENSPLGRVIEKGNSGSAFQPGNGHSTRFSYHANTAADQVRLFQLDGSSSGFYPANELWKDEITDQDGKKQVTFTDKGEKVVLRRVQLDEQVDGQMVNWLETYYIYNPNGSERMIISPKGVLALSASGWTLSPDIKNQYVHEFIYDDRGRLIEKKVPGQGLFYFCYDRFDRLVLFQDALSRAVNKWTFVKYDRRGNAVMAGLYTNTTNTSRASIQTNVIDPLYASATDAYYEQRSGGTHGYTNQSFPTSNIEVQLVNYYDDYDFNGDRIDDMFYEPLGLANEGSAIAFVPGLPVASKKLVLGTTQWLESYIFYDKYDRVIQVRSNNHLSSALDNQITTVYDFEGKKTLIKNYHNAGSGRVTNVINRFEYDHMGRLLKVWQSNNGAAEQQLSQNEYNALGQLVDKKLHVNGAAFLQSIDYRYSIQGWLLSINNSLLNTNAANDESNDYFGMDFSYELPISGINSSSDVTYNGNITAMRWKGGGVPNGTQDQQSYKFSYDKANRMKTATSQMYGTLTFDKEPGALNEDITYDVNGNILTLKRNARGHQIQIINNVPKISFTAEQIDNLTYAYNPSQGDQLLKVTDVATAMGGFDNGGSGANDDYVYDAAGNLLTDQNKGITTGITYNHLGKPTLVSFSDGRKVEYLYDAVGTKLKMKSYDTNGTLTTTTDYVNEFVYVNNVLSFFSTYEGRAVNNNSVLEYQYAIKDHQNNTRIMFTSVNPTKAPLVATFENITTDQQNFLNVNSSTTYWVSKIPAAKTGTKSIRMNQTYKTGPAKSIGVYPGDVMDLEVYAYYEGTSGFGGTNQTMSTIISSVANVLKAGLSPPDAIRLTNGVNSAYTSFGQPGNLGDSRPTAYLNYILLNKDMKLMDMGWKPVPSTANGAWQKVSFPSITIKEAGFMYVYLSYEGVGTNWVYFDELSIGHTKTSIIQYNEYYPFGMQTGNSWTREDAIRNDYLSNGGSELNGTTGWFETEYRNYDASLGRFIAIDPMASKFADLSGYHYSANNPVNISDPTGADYSGYGYAYDYAPNYLPNMGFQPPYGTDYNYDPFASTYGGFDSFFGGYNDYGGSGGYSGFGNPYGGASGGGYGFMPGMGSNCVGCMDHVIAICPTCPPTPEFQPYIDDPNNVYEYDPKTGTVSLVPMLAEVTVTASRTGSSNSVVVTVNYWAGVADNTGDMASAFQSMPALAGGISRWHMANEKTFKQMRKAVSSEQYKTLGKFNKWMKLGGKVLGVTGVVTSGAEFFTKPNWKNAIKFGINLGSMALKATPLGLTASLAIGVADATGGLDALIDLGQNAVGVSDNDTLY